tara:strand:- start:334 stop:702 length:369 start_codon:yes stop_codon:yes gene_type:complete
MTSFYRSERNKYEIKNIDANETNKICKIDILDETNKTCKIDNLDEIKQICKVYNIYEIKKNFAIKFAKSLRNNGVVVSEDVFVRRLISYSCQRGIKHITKLKRKDIESCLSIINDVQYINGV